MNKDNIQTIIRELFRELYNACSAPYRIEGGLMTEEGSIAAQEVAIQYWNERNENEIERDERAGVTKIDYVEWVMAELSELVSLTTR